MSEANRLRHCLGQFKGGGMLVASCREPVDGGADLPGVGGAQSAQHRPGEDAEPDLYLVEPRGVGGGVVELHVRVSGQPAVMLWLMGVEVVQNHMELGIGVLRD